MHTCACLNSSHYKCNTNVVKGVLYNARTLNRYYGTILSFPWPAGWQAWSCRKFLMFVVQYHCTCIVKGNLFLPHTVALHMFALKWLLRIMKRSGSQFQENLQGDLDFFEQIIKMMHEV